MRKLMMVIMIVVLAGCTLGGDNPPDEVELVEQVDTPAPQTVEDTPVPAATEPEPTPTFAMPTPLPIPSLVVSLPVLDPTPINQPVQSQSAPVIQPAAGGRSYSLSSSGSGVQGSGTTILNVPTYHYAANPVDNRFSVIDTAGNLYISGPNGEAAFRVEQSPYTQYPGPTREENNAAAEMAAWSPSGQYLAFVVNGDKQAADGVWYFQPGQFGPLQLIVDCPFGGFPGCNIVRVPDGFSHWESKEVHWSPNSQTVLVNVALPDQGRRGLIIKGITRDERTRDERPPIILYDYGTWGIDGRILASGRNADGVAGLFWLNPDGSFNSVAYNASNAGLWMGWAAQQADGDIVALGKAGGPDGPVAIYNEVGTALTGPIGAAFPDRVEWSPDRRAVLVVAGGRQYVAQTGGQITDITDSTGGVPVNWMQ